MLMAFAKYPKTGYHINMISQPSLITVAAQADLFGENSTTMVSPPRSSLLKWVGNKYRFASQIVSFFPTSYRRYFEPFLGSGAVLATLAPRDALASDIFKPLIEIWQELKTSPETLVQWYAVRWQRIKEGEKVAVYEAIKASYNSNPNGADLLFLARSCYGGIVRFRQADGYMSTPCGIHNPIAPPEFARRVSEWNRRVSSTTFRHMEFEEAIRLAGPGDLVYCDPPYSDSQSILYGAQAFSLERLFREIEGAKVRGAKVALSIDGTKRSGRHNVILPIPPGLFEREVLVEVGRSMLKRFQMNGKTLEEEVVHDRLLLTY